MKKIGIIGFILVFLVIGAIILGYIKNIVGLIKCDFKPSYKAEILRGIGVVIVPMGCLEGYIEIKDE